VGSLWALDISQDDKVIAVGSENNFIRLYSLHKLLFTNDEFAFGEEENKEIAESK
jgi:WD40 repeat protein